MTFALATMTFALATMTFEVATRVKPGAAVTI